ncbi:hypothetical protein ACIQK6_29790 [Streptomyces sp. NPDC091682]|uniref:hypothetical protein n=1 Tax=Streptomyces sp. NPDC091682 TaxID=3366005 RepID=UPI00381D5F69
MRTDKPVHGGKGEPEPCVPGVARRPADRRPADRRRVDDPVWFGCRTLGPGGEVVVDAGAAAGSGELDDP